LVLGRNRSSEFLIFSFIKPGENPDFAEGLIGLLTFVVQTLWPENNKLINSPLCYRDSPYFRKFLFGHISSAD